MKTRKQIKKIDNLFSKRIRKSKTYKTFLKKLRIDIKYIKSNVEDKKEREIRIQNAINIAFEDIFSWIILENKLKISNDFINRYKSRLIASALSTKEGRRKLAKAMVEPIRRKINYQEIGKKLVDVTEMPKCAPISYKKVKQCRR